MNKFVIIGIILVLILAGGFAWKQFAPEGENESIETGVVREVTVVAKKLEWRFEPETITVDQGDRVKMTVINEDDFDHGVAIDAFGVSQRLPANGSIYIEFVATKSGEFPFYCSVSCGDSASTGNLPNGEVQTGPYAGTFRGHFEHIGRFIVTAFKRMTGNEDDGHAHGVDDEPHEH